MHFFFEQNFCIWLNIMKTEVSHIYIRFELDGVTYEACEIRYKGRSIYHEYYFYVKRYKHGGDGDLKVMFSRFKANISVPKFMSFNRTPK
jgi:hypothetical protein